MGKEKELYTFLKKNERMEVYEILQVSFYGLLRYINFIVTFFNKKNIYIY